MPFHDDPAHDVLVNDFTLASWLQGITADHAGTPTKRPVRLADILAEYVKRKHAGIARK
jgi:hypothetical protein